MKKTLAVLSMLFTLAACEDSDKAASQVINASSEANSLVLQDGTAINLNGSIIKTSTKKDGKTEVITHTVKFDTGSKIAENSIYGMLSKQGYTREVVENTGEKFKIHYYKKGHPTIGSVYQEKTTETGLSSVLAIYWKVI
ncbi:hypothetical protein JFT59_11505 [Pseudomonas sp. MF6784]|uniref:hypothetical protein n=1 Tax=unclassified Pseudomonas TaxID=196821 RepID=UPI0018E7FDC0|nr:MULTISPECIES: hypothetical protein [unclassified Pseudomonas]MBJ2251821.1 hypothetical protein [Pseudomonas sp. MF6784]MBK3439704.1 hypothetical protein [Pseudomonas sp. MF7448]